MSETTHEWLTQPSRAERRAAGKAVRDTLPLAGLAEVGATMVGRDAVALIGARDAGRLEWLVPIRYGRMLRSAFTFYRGSAALMAHDLAFAPASGLTVQLCGDAHLLNFGIFGSPERSLVFDLNDFDETLPGPFEWDVKRLVASVVVAARDRGFKPKRQREIAFATAERYRTAMREFADLTALETWHRQLEVDTALQTVDDEDWRAYASAVAERARGKNHLQAVARFTEVVDGERRIVTEPPLIVPLASVAGLLQEDPAEAVRQAFTQYRESVRDDVQVLLDRYTYVDAAIKVVGVGSVGTRCVIVLMQGADENDLLFLQVKQASASVLEPYLAVSQYAHHGERVVAGQRLMQSASDAFLGWATGPLGNHYYWRQLRDWKGSADVEKMSERLLLRYGQVCAWTLAKAHARSGDAVAIAAYLGSSNRFEAAITSFGVSYADINEQDYLALQQAVVDGRVVAHDDAPATK
ncbi:MAG: hypothetical protein CK540_04775 [Thermoleophilia bacterium]|nr:MAG: hypothetical protein CK540_04775 [Thermoleophilia bacterium]